MKPIYITHSSAITPQQYSNEGMLRPLQKDIDGILKVTEPDYTSVIPAMQLRRMSRMLRMGVFAGMDCIRQANIEKPDAIITGTGKGSMTDTEKFVKELKTYNEEALNPTPFILSTYNAINGAIALQTKATGYNQTYVHGGSSFELSLYDAQLSLNRIEDKRHYLVGGFDEVTPEYFIVKSKVGYWKKDRENNISLFEQSNSKGTIAGEGAAFFMLSNKNENAIACIHTINTSYRSSPADIENIIQRNLDKAGWKKEEVDMMILGLNGNSDDEKHYQHIINSVPEQMPVMAFKHLCGEYETSGSFAVWLVCQLLQQKNLPEETWYRSPAEAHFKPKKIVYYNHYRGLNHNVILLSEA